MKPVVVAFSSLATVERMSALLRQMQLPVAAGCTTGAEVLRAVEAAPDCVVLGGCKLAGGEGLSHMLHHSAIPAVLLGTPEQLDSLPARAGETVRLPLPVRRSELIELLQSKTATARPAADRADIDLAKACLMRRHGLTEPEAHHRLQRASMNCGLPMAEMARNLLARESRPA